MTDVITQMSWSHCLPRTRRMVCLVVLGVLFSCSTTRESLAHAQPAAVGQRFEQLDARYWKILVGRPRKGTALERWYGLWSDAGRTEELIDRVRAEAEADADNPQLQLLWGLLLEQRGEFDEAQSALRTAAELADGDFYPHYALGSLAARRGMLDEAAAALRRAAELNPPRTPWLEIYKLLGHVQLRGGQRFEALDTWAKVAEQFPDDLPILQEMAELLAAERQYDEAIARWEQVAAQAKNDRNLSVEAERNIAQVEVRAGRRSAAIERLDNLLNRLEPEGWLAADVRRQIETLFMEEGDLAGLANFYRRRLETRDDLDTMLSLASVLSNSGDYKESLTLLNNAVERAPHREDVQQQLIEQLSRLGKYENALQVAREFSAESPNDIEGIRRLADLEVQAATSNGNTDLLSAAGHHYQQMATVRPDDASLALSAAHACESGARRAMLFGPENEVAAGSGEGLDVGPLFATAESLYREAVLREPERVAFHEQLGSYLHRQSDSDAALVAWRMIASDSRDTAEHCVQLANILQRHEFHEEAAAAFRRSIVHDPTRKEPRKQLVRLLMNEQSFDAALTELDQLDALAKSSAETAELFQLRVDVLRLADRVATSILQLQKQIAATESTPDTHWLLALLLVENRQPLAALDEIEIALSDRPEDVQVLKAVASIAGKAGEQARAIEVYEQLSRLQPQLATVHLAQVARLHLMNGDAEQARSVAEQMVAAHPSNPAGYRMLAEVAAFTGLATERLAAVRRAVEVSPADPTARRQLAELLERRNQNEESLEHYWRAFELVDSTPERMHLVSIMVPLAERMNEYPRFLERLRNAERELTPSPEASLLVVEARKVAGDLRGALQEVKSVLAQGGNQRDALILAVSLAQALSEHQQAVDFQRRVVELSPNRPALEQLAECCLAADDLDGASQAWRQIVRELEDPQALFEMVDVEIRRGELNNAKYLLAIGVEEYPDDWRVLLRAGHVAMLEGDDDTARNHYQNVWLLSEATHEVDEESPGPDKYVPHDQSFELPRELAEQVPETAEFLVALDTLDLMAQQRWVSDLAKRQKEILSKRQGTKRQAEAYERLLQHQRANQQRKVTEQFDMPQTLGPAKVMALCGLLELARHQGEVDRWYEEQQASRESGASARLAMVAFADKQFVRGQDILTGLISQDPQSPVPHVLRLLGAQTPELLNGLSDSQRDLSRLAVETSFQWLQTQRPAWIVQMRPLFLNALLNLQAAQQAEAALRWAIENATDIRELPALSKLATRVGNLALQQRVFEQAVSLPLGEQDQLAAVEPLRRLLEAKFLYSDDEQYVGTMIAVMDRYFRATQPATVSMETDVDGQFAESNSDAAQFPAPTPYINQQRLSVVARVYQHCDAASRVFLLQDFLQQRAGECEGSDRLCYSLASIYVQWWSGELGRALDDLRALCESAPQEAPLRIILAKAYYADGNYELAIGELDRLHDRINGIGYGVKRLRRELIGTMVEDDD